MGKAVVKDLAGVEIALEWNLGALDTVKWPTGTGRNATVSLAVPGFQHLVTGALDTHNDAMTAVVKAAEGSSAQLAFRIEVHRDPKKVAADAPMDWNEMKADRFRRITDIAPADSDRGRAILTIAEAEGAVGAVGGSAPVHTSAPVPNEPPPPSHSPGGSQADTWAFAAAVGCVDLAFDLLMQFDTESANPRSVEQLAGVLLRSCDAAQVAVNGGEVNRATRSHTRARGAVRTALGAGAPPLDQPAGSEGWIAWETRLVKIAITLLKVATKLHELAPERAA